VGEGVGACVDERARDPRLSRRRRRQEVRADDSGPHALVVQQSRRAQPQQPERPRRHAGEGGVDHEGVSET
jgi:hypothetical protein